MCLLLHSKKLQLVVKFGVQSPPSCTRDFFVTERYGGWIEDREGCPRTCALCTYKFRINLDLVLNNLLARITSKLVYVLHHCNIQECAIKYIVATEQR